MIDLDAMTQGYMDAALWADCACSCDSGECDCEPGGRVYLQVSDDDRAMIRSLCERFAVEHRADCLAYLEAVGTLHCPSDSLGRTEYSASELLGHDMRLTSGGHGTGFWDRGLGDLGQRLADAVDYGTPYSRHSGGDCWDTGNGLARFDHA